MRGHCKKSRGIISMDQEPVINRVKQFADVVRQNFQVKKIILYGSYAKGSASEHSDIDVAVVLDSNEEDLLTSEAKLFKLRRDIDVRIEPVLLDEQNDKSGFLEEITKTGEIIYSSD
jgi:predicted nucleotidyltransferase